jgi:hypothetical protein
MPYQPTKSLAAFIMGDALTEAMKWAPSIMGLVRFGGIRMEFFPFIVLCLDGYIRGAALGYTFKDKYDLLVSMMVNPDKVKKHTDYLHDVAQKRVNSYNQEITSIIDFFISTELAKDNLTFDDFLNKGKTKIKIDSAGPRIKLVFEEGTAFGSDNPDTVSQLISLECRTSSLDWEKAKLMGLTFDINSQEMNLKFLEKWATYNLRMYARECFPELMAALEL